MDGAPATTARNGDELVVTPASGLITGNGFIAEVGYDGEPKPLRNEALGEGGFLHTADGAIALGQPESAEHLVPGQRPPLRQGRVRLRGHRAGGADRDQQRRAGRQDQPGGWTTWKWSEQPPMASYLSTLAIGKFRITDRRAQGPAGVSSRSPPTLAKGAADASIAQTVEVADYLESVFGPYPFDAYGGVVISDGRISLRAGDAEPPGLLAGFFRQGENTEVVAHELAHQWFGDSVALARWQDIWLNEGFATYAEWLWAEHTEGAHAPRRSFDRRYARMSAQVWRTPPGKPGARSCSASRSTSAAAMTLHALRLAVGDKAFFEIAQDLGGGEARRQRHHCRVRRPRRAGLRQAARRALRRLALRHRERSRATLPISARSVDAAPASVTSSRPARGGRPGMRRPGRRGAR